MKDPAALIYKDKWIASTNGMKAAFRAWYFDLLIYQFNHPEGIPNDQDEIAGICRVLPSEYDLFKQFLKQVLKQKFKQTESNLLTNDVANEVIQGREKFIEKRSKSGKIGYLMKIFKAENLAEDFDYKEVIDFLMTVDEEELESMKNKQVLKQVLKQRLKQKGKLYINVDINKDNEDIKGGMGEKKETKKKFIPPTQDEVINYFFENGYPESVAIKAHKYYSEANWKDSRGNPVKNWKQKMQGVWFRPENKIETTAPAQVNQQPVSGRQTSEVMSKNLLTNLAAMDGLIDNNNKAQT